MKAVNLYQFIDSWKSLETSIFLDYINYMRVGSAQNGVRESEMKDISCFTDYMLQNEICVGNCDGFFINYSIPQIGKEFDLLRFGENYILNVEIKRNSSFEKIEKQLKRNYYYLKFSDVPIKLFTFIANTKDLYQLKSDKIEKANISELIDSINSQAIFDSVNPDTIFDPIRYLVSPFNSTRKFMEEDYFLTKQQEEIKNQVMQSIDLRVKRNISISGKAGTGKTLLTYDIAKNSIRNGFKVLILHCAQLNEGQHYLISNYGWNICQARDGILKDFNEFDVIIVDEAQRARPSQFNTIVNKLSFSNAICIFSHDKNQCLNNYEISHDISNQILSLCNNSFNLTNKIRTNKEIADFITRLFDSKSIYNITAYPNVSLSYCSDQRKAQYILKSLSKKGWKVPKYTPGTRSSFHYEKYGIPEEDSVHAVIGQEYDFIVGVIDSHFYYDKNNTLQSKNDGYYSQRQMLFQILTRTRKNLHILVLDNPEIFERCIEILSYEYKFGTGTSTL